MSSSTWRRAWCRSSSPHHQSPLQICSQYHAPVQSLFVQIYHEAPVLSCSPNRAPPAPRNFVILTWLAKTETDRNMILLLLMGCGVVEITNPSSFSFVLTDSYLAASGDVQPTGQNSQRCGRAMAKRCQNARCRIYVEL